MLTEESNGNPQRSQVEKGDDVCKQYVEYFNGFWSGEKMIFLFRRGMCFWTTFAVIWHLPILNFSFENQTLLWAFLPSFCFPYRLCWLDTMYINLNALIFKPSSGLYYEDKSITELLSKEFLASALWLLQCEWCSHGWVNGIFLIKACLAMILVHCAAD